MCCGRGRVEIITLLDQEGGVGMGKGKKKEDLEIRDSMLVFSLPVARKKFAQPLINHQSRNVFFIFVPPKMFILLTRWHHLSPSTKFNSPVQSFLEQTTLFCFDFCCSYKETNISSVTKEKKQGMPKGIKANIFDTADMAHYFVLFSPVSHIRNKDGEWRQLKPSSGGKEGWKTCITRNCFV